MKVYVACSRPHYRLNLHPRLHVSLHVHMGAGNRTPRDGSGPSLEHRTRNEGGNQKKKKESELVAFLSFVRFFALVSVILQTTYALHADDTRFASIEAVFMDFAYTASGIQAYQKEESRHTGTDIWDTCIWDRGDGRIDGVYPFFFFPLVWVMLVRGIFGGHEVVICLVILTCVCCAFWAAS